MFTVNQKDEQSPEKPSEKPVTPDTTGVGEDVEEMERSLLHCTVSGNANWYSHCGKQYGGSSKR